MRCGLRAVHQPAKEALIRFWATLENAPSPEVHTPN